MEGAPSAEQARRKSITDAVRTRRGPKVYNESASDKEKERFRKVWMEKLKEAGCKPYGRGEVSEEEHIKVEWLGESTHIS